MTRDDITNKEDIECVEKVEDVIQEDLALHAELQHLSEDEVKDLDRTLTRRLDCTLLPVVILLFLLNILDRNNIANAKVAGLTKTLGITDQEYNTCLMIFYVGCRSILGQ